MESRDVKLEPERVTRFTYDNWNLVAELDPSNNVLRSYVWGTGLLLFINASGNTYQVGYDGSENVHGLVHAGTGKLAAMYEYDPFGQNIKLTGDYAAQNPFRFANHYADTESDLVYYGLRYYNANTGRWLSRDPIEERGGFNLYAMAANNPVNLIDVLGLQPKKAIRKPKAPEKCNCCCVEDLDVVTSGNFQGGLSLNHYFPFLIGRTEFISSNPAIAGPFEDRGASGTRIGAKVQIVSKIAKNNRGEFCNFSQHYWVGSEIVEVASRVTTAELILMIF